MIERLFLKSGANTTIEAKIDSLMLINPSEQQCKDLAYIVRDGGSLTLVDAVERLSAYPHLWLNNLKPGIFDQQTLQKIEIISWRGKNQKLHGWSGLRLDAENNRLNFILDPDAVGAKNQSRLEVRWKGFPEELAKGAVEYSVAVLSGDDELAEKNLVHTGKNPQKCVFTFDDFEIDKGTKFEAVVRIQPLGNEDLSKDTEDFILLFGQTTGERTSSVGNEVRALVEGAISLERREDFDDACNKYHNSQYFGKDKKDYITFHYPGGNAKVFCPPLLRAIEEDWANRQGQMGRWIVPVRTDGSQAGEPEFIQFSSGCSTAAGDRLNRASSELSQLALKSQGLVGMILGFNKIVEEYINLPSAVWP